MVDINKPFPNEHAARLLEPVNLDPKGYHRTEGGSLFGGRTKVPASISIVWGKTEGKDSHPVAQALRFPINSWTEEKAREWLKDNGISPVSFTPAEKAVDKCDSDILVQAWDTETANYQHSYEKKDRPGVVKSALLLKSIHSELKSRKDVIIRKSHAVMEQKDIRDLLDISKLSPQGKRLGVNLLVIDREPTPIKGIMRYSLGCVIDRARPARGENIIKVADTFDFDSGARLDEIISCDVSSCRVQEKDGYFTPSLSIIKVGSSPVKGKKTPLDKSMDIIKGAHGAGVLDAGKDIIIRMAESKLFDINVDKQFGVSMTKSMPIIKGNMPEGIVYGIVYAVNEVDADGDYATPEEVQKACWRFMEEYQTMNLLHNQYLPGNSYALVECACALADVLIGNQKIKKGDWYIAVRIKDLELRAMIERGEIAAFSMEGSAMPGSEIPALESQKRRA